MYSKALSGNVFYQMNASTHEDLLSNVYRLYCKRGNIVGTAAVESWTAHSVQNITGLVSIMVWENVCVSGKKGESTFLQHLGKIRERRAYDGDIT